jgi:tetratricopeptide (TPR) repeat protein
MFSRAAAPIVKSTVNLVKPTAKMRAAAAAKTSRDHVLAKRYAEALYAGLQAVELQRNSPNYLVGLIDTCIKSGMPKVAELVARGAIREGMEDSRLYLGLGKALAKQRQLPSALECVNYALKMTPDLQDALTFKKTLAQK